MANARRAKGQTLLELAVANAGLRTGMRGVLWCFSWSIAREDLGHEPTVDEVAEWWDQSRRTAFREQDAFRKAFPQLSTPEPIYETAAVQRLVKEYLRLLRQRRDGRAGSARDVERLALQIGLQPAP